MVSAAPAWRALRSGNPGSVLLETAGGFGDDHTSYSLPSRNCALAQRQQTTSDAAVRHQDATRDRLYAAGQSNTKRRTRCMALPVVRRHRRWPASDSTASRCASITTLVISTAALPAEDTVRRSLPSCAFAALRKSTAKHMRKVRSGSAPARSWRHVPGQPHHALDAELHATPLVLYESFIAAQPVDSPPSFTSTTPRAVVFAGTVLPHRHDGDAASSRVP